MKWLEYHEEPVTLHSGAKSHWLVDGAAMFADEHIREMVIDLWSGAMLTHTPGLTKPWIYGVPNGGTPWAKALAERWGVEPRAEYQSPAPYNIAEDGGVTFIVDDVATTGASLDPFKEPKLVVVRRGPVSITARWMDVTLPTFKETP